jgi:hypothetical protein
MVDPPLWAGGENTTEHPTAQGFFARRASFLGNQEMAGNPASHHRVFSWGKRPNLQCQKCRKKSWQSGLES